MIPTRRDTSLRRSFSSPFSGTFFQSATGKHGSCSASRCFRPLSREPFFNSVPAKPQPVCSRKRIRGGDGGSLHQALSFGDEMPIFPVRTGIGGDGNEKWCCLIPSYSSLLSNFRVQGSGFRVQGSGFRVVVAASPQYK